ncbi:MAG TPA: penicillin-binding transpeptidase domain-containing protein [Candidatus Dormibacteraeota bacterium]|jgi:penicillin-binding protein 2|nr:penicillin-binding transpeptidase domain-containing protein [Candidatus Dormibacteraeota bacterium]
MTKTSGLGKTSLAIFLSACCVLPAPASAATPSGKPKAVRSTRHRYVPREKAVDPTLGDITDFDDPIVRAAAVDALGKYNGSVVAVDPNSGRILAVVNQKMAYSDGAIPCSTIKPTIALAALEENVITRDTMLKVGRRKYMNLTEAMAHSNNVFFEQLGQRMGFETVSKYGRLLGLGELAGYNLNDERPGAFPMAPPQKGGVARMSSFGEGIQVTPFQLASLAAAFANGGTLYYLQYPQLSQPGQEVPAFEPRIKRELNIAPLLPELREGMLAAVLYGTGKRSFDVGGDELPAGKTGTCSDDQSHVGWFLSYADEAHPKIALAVLIRGRSSLIKGPLAAGVAGRIYRRLREQNYFASLPPRAQLLSGR